MLQILCGKMDEGLGWMVEEMGREELLEEVQRLKVMVGDLQDKLKSEATEKVNALIKKATATEEVNTLKEKLDNLRKKMEQVCEERSQMTQVIGRNNDERAKILSEKTDLLLIAIKHHKMMKEARERLECPVCLVVPRRGPVPSCPSGHLTCSPCLKKMRRDGKGDNCPTCRAPMGDGTSLLAKVLIENMDHVCSLKGCKEKVAFEDFEKHQEECSHRLVICPGSNLSCQARVAFCDVEAHILACPDLIEHNAGGNMVVFTYEHQEDLLVRTNMVWSTLCFESNFNKIFFVRMDKTDGIFSIEVAMKGSNVDCEKYLVEVTVMNVDMPIFKSQYHPRPIGKDNEKQFSLSFSQAAISKVWKFNKMTRRFFFDVSVKIDVI